jgi:predicted amidohydrolase YtcJ
LTLAAFEEAGSRLGDRIEHGGIIPKEAIAPIRALGLTVVTQPGFIHDRGDRYLRDVEPSEQSDLYRCGSLLEAGIALAGGSDAPYATPDPWLAIRTAVARRTSAGAILGDTERIDAASALALYHKSQSAPAMAVPRLAPGAAADLCLLKAPLIEALRAPEAGLVRATIIRGAIAFLDE